LKDNKNTIGEKTVELKRSAGVLAHPTCFPSDYGIGDLGESCYNFIDFLYASKQKIWQILPLNPTSYGNSPYQSPCTFAGNYLLISPDILYKKSYLSLEDIELRHKYKLEECQRRINYETVIEFKKELFKRAFKNFYTRDIDNLDFKRFCQCNEYWLDDYALFMSIKDLFIQKRKHDHKISQECENIFPEFMSEDEKNNYYYGAVWSTWPKDLVERNKKCLNEYKEKLNYEIVFYKFLQFEFFDQWNKVKIYANSKNILIIGDLPIFVAYDSVDVWINSKLFEIEEKGLFMTRIAGVPPDNLYDGKDGQLWGNPVYNWQQHKEENYLWWSRRINNTTKHVDIIRIDHFRGFESYWSVPFGSQTASNGEWFKGPGKDIFDQLHKNNSELKIIIEALGHITEPVTNLIEMCHYPTIKVLEFGFDNTKHNEHEPHNFKDQNIIIYTSTHDNDTALGWYTNLSEERKDKFRRYMNVSGNDPAWDLIRLAYSSVAIYAIASIQDLMSLNSYDRMNTPGQLKNNWEFRYTTDMLTDEIKQRLQYLVNLFDR
jgi:4-alpha-glucanotransferase